MLHIDRNVEEASLPSREAMAGDVGLLLGPETAVLTAKEWKALDVASRALTKFRDGFGNEPPGQGDQAFHNFLIIDEVLRLAKPGWKEDYDPSQVAFGVEIYNTIMGSQIPALLQSLGGAPVYADNFLANVMYKGDDIERHDHNMDDYAVVFCLHVPKDNSVPLKLERLVSSATIEQKEAFSQGLADGQEIVPEDMIIRDEVILAARSVLILPGDCMHYMAPVSGSRRSIGCFFKKQGRKKS